MGVISHNRNTLPAVAPLNNDSLIFDFLIESPLSTDVEEDWHENEEDIGNATNRAVITYGTPKRRRAKCGTPRTPCVRNTMLNANKRHWGARRKRRYENNQALDLDFDPDDICDDLSDMLPDTTTAFSQLFIEKEKMEAWNEFLHKNEDEQDKILRKMDKYKTKHAFTDFSMAASSKDASSYLAPNSAEKRFRRLDKSCRFVLIHKPGVWNKLEHIEDEISGCFMQNAKGIFIVQTISGFERILIHAAAQFLDLKSISYNDGGGMRKTKIINIKPNFTPPNQTLAAYLKEHQQDMCSADAQVYS